MKSLLVDDIITGTFRGVKFFVEKEKTKENSWTPDEQNISKWNILMNLLYLKKKKRFDDDVGETSKGDFATNIYWLLILVYEALVLLEIS